MNQTTPTSAATASATTPKSGSERDLDALSKEIATLRRDLGSLTELVGDIGSRRGKEAKLKAEEEAAAAARKSEKQATRRNQQPMSEASLKKVLCVYTIQ